MSKGLHYQVTFPWVLRNSQYPRHRLCSQEACIRGLKKGKVFWVGELQFCGSQREQPKSILESVCKKFYNDIYAKSRSDSYPLARCAFINCFFLQSSEENIRTPTERSQSIHPSPTLFCFLFKVLLRGNQYYPIGFPTLRVKGLTEMKATPLLSLARVLGNWDRASLIQDKLLDHSLVTTSLLFPWEGWPTLYFCPGQ